MGSGGFILISVSERGPVATVVIAIKNEVNCRGVWFTRAIGGGAPVIVVALVRDNADLEEFGGPEDVGVSEPGI